jgi:peptidoglycan/LPS O-acetylase OafA/YrhL
LTQEALAEDRAVHYIPELDGLRGIAIIMVILFHARLDPAAWYAPLPFLHTLLDLGNTGVDFFFVLSGFLITSILLSTKDAPAKSYFWSFYARRSLRIFPLYFLAVAIFFYLELPFLHHHNAALEVHSSEQFWYWTYLVNWHDAAGHVIAGNGHFWSLAVEEQFYLVWPAVVFFCAARYFPAVCAGLGSIALLLRVALSTGHFMAPALLPEYIHRVTITRMDTLAVGALIAVLVRNPEWTQRVKSRIGMIATVAFGSFVALWWTQQRGTSLPFNTVGYLASAIAYGCVVFVCVTEQGGENWPCRMARWRPLRSVGRYSYAMYVFHLLVIYCLSLLARFVIVPRMLRIPGINEVPVLAITLSAMLICVGLSYLLAFASWHLYERPFLSLKKYFPYQVKAPVFSETTVSADGAALP